VTMNSPKDITANYKTQYQVTFNQSGVGTDFTGTIVTIDGTNYTTLPQSFWWDKDSNHTFSFASPLNVNGKRYVWNSTSGLTTLQSGILKITSSGSVTGNYKTQYQITVTASPSGALGGTFKVTYTQCGTTYTNVQKTTAWTEWVDANTNVTVSQPQDIINGPPDTRYKFDHYDPSASVTMNQAKTITLVYKTQYTVTFAQTGLNPLDSTGIVVTVDASPKTVGDLPFSKWVDSGSSVTYSYSSIVSSTVSGKRYRLNSVTGPASPITVTSAITVTGNYVTQYSVTFAQTGLDSSATGNVVTVNGGGKTFGDLPYTHWVDGGSSVTYSYSSTVSSTTSGKRFILTSVTGPSSPISVTSAVTVTGNYKTQYYLTVNTDPTGLSPAPTPSSNWYDAGAKVVETAPSKSYKNSVEYNFKYWDVDGPSQGIGVNTITVTMNAPHTATAHYEAPPPAAVGGYAAPIDKSHLLAPRIGLSPWIGLVFAFLAAMAVMAILIRRRNRRL